MRRMRLLFVMRAVLLLSGSKISMERLKSVGRHFRSPLVHLLLIPMTIEPDRRFRQILGKRQPVIAFAAQDVADLPP